MQRLHRVDHAHLGPLGLERGEHRVQVGLGQHGHLQRRAGQPLGAQPDLRRGLLPGDVERPAPGALEVPERHRRQRRLADAGRAADQHERAGHQPAAEDPVQLADAGVQPRVAAAPRPRPAAAASPPRAPRRPSPPPCRGSPPTSVFHSPQPGHCPIQRGASAAQAEQTKTVVARGMSMTVGRGLGRFAPSARSCRLARARRGATNGREAYSRRTRLLHRWGGQPCGRWRWSSVWSTPSRRRSMTRMAVVRYGASHCRA